ncbi:MICOS complex subunit MIC60, partial [Enterobacter roggenkampii]|uniref:MICOS complex subunit MIC60 n=1 Tax=Enterobacter roggenkampii TaxID=1812935 RepID=UPI0020751044
LMMSLWDALRMNMMISYQELVRTFPKIFPNSTQTLLVSFDTYNPAILKFKKNVIYVTQFK